MKVFKVIAIMAGVGFTLGVFSMMISSSIQEDEFRARIPAMDAQVQNFVNAIDQDSIDYYREICLAFIEEIESNSVNSKNIAWAERNGELIKQTDWDRSEAGIAANKKKEEEAKAKAKKDAERKNSLEYKKAQASYNLEIGGSWEQAVRSYFMSMLDQIGGRGYSCTEKIQIWAYKNKVKFRVNFTYKDKYGNRHKATSLWESDYDGNLTILELNDLY